MEVSNWLAKRVFAAMGLYLGKTLDVSKAAVSKTKTERARELVLYVYTE